MYKNVIFDLDGVIVSTDEYHYQAWKQIADGENILFNRQVNNRLRGVSRMASLEIILEQAARSYSQEEKEALAEKKNTIYRELLQNLRPEETLQGVRETLKVLREKGVKVAIGSSSKNTMMILDRLGMKNDFDSIADGTEITRSKPDPEVFLLAAKKLGAKPEDCLVVEDAAAGVQAGHAAGMTVAGIGEAAQTADYPLETMEELLHLLPKDFIIGSATAAHQVESMNTNSDIWAEEHVEGSIYKDKSDRTCDHYMRYREDIALMAGAGLKAYRFSIEWARIEPEKGVFSAEALAHYEDVIKACEEYGLMPIVTLHHFTSPKWLMQHGGWKGADTPKFFGRYVRYVLGTLGKRIPYIVTMNEINIATMLKQLFAEWNFVPPIGMAAEGWTAPEWREQAAIACGTDLDHYFTIHMASEPEHIEIIRQAHHEAVKAVRELAPEAKVGVSLALSDVVAKAGGEAVADKVWQSYFGQYKDIAMEADFMAVQNYEREFYDANGRVPAEKGTELTECGYPYCPEAVSSVVSRVYKETGMPVMVTENGIATQNDGRRMDFIHEALTGLQGALDEGVPLLGYIYWSALDNLEWAMGFDKHFGLIGVNRENMMRTVKPSCRYLGTIAQTHILR